MEQITPSIRRVCVSYFNDVLSSENSVFMSDQPPPYPGIDPTLTTFMPPPPHANGYAGAAEPPYPPGSAAGRYSHKYTFR